MTKSPTEDSPLKTITCRAAVAWKPNQPLVLEQVQVRPPKAGEVRIQLFATSMCHTDAYTLQGLDPEGVFPVILGHEGAGIVESIGEGVMSVSPGDHVIPLYMPECHNCKFCRSGKTNLCSVIRINQGRGLMQDGTTRFSCRGIDIFHFMGTSTFSEYTVVAEISVAVVSRKAHLHKICLFGCGVTTGYGAVINTARVEKGSKIAVFGAGCVGLAVIRGAVDAGASMIIAIDRSPIKEKIAMDFGATHFINPDSCNVSVQDRIIEMTTEDGAGGVDYSFECIGNVEIMRMALESCHKGWGQSIIIGVAAAGEMISTRPFQLVTGRTWKGTAFGGVKGRTQLAQWVERHLEGEFDLDGFITAYFPFENITKAWQLMHEPQTIKIVMYYKPIDGMST